MKNLNKIPYVSDSFSAFLVENAQFTQNEEYPILRDEMISKEVPAKIMPFNKAITFQGDLSNTYICFYEKDETFERVRRNPKRYLNFFKRTAGIIGLDFSIYSDMQIIKQKQQMNDNLSLTYFYGNNGIKIIPNLRCGIDELVQEFFEAIPKHNIVAIGTYGFIKTRPQRSEWYCFLETIISTLLPTKILVYGPLSDNIFEAYKNKVQIYLYDTWMDQRIKEYKSHVN